MYQLIHSSVSNEIYVQTEDGSERYTILEQQDMFRRGTVIWLHYRLRDANNPEEFTRNLFVPKYGWQQQWDAMQPNDFQRVDFDNKGHASHLAVHCTAGGKLFLSPDRTGEHNANVTSMAIDQSAIPLVFQALQEAGWTTGPSPRSLLSSAEDIHPLAETLLSPR